MFPSTLASRGGMFSGAKKALLFKKRGKDPAAVAWASAVTANGGTYSVNTLAALSTKIKALKSAGLWGKYACINPMCGDQLAACLIQYKSGVWAPAINNNFVAGDYTELTGLTGNGTSKYLDTGLIPNVSLTLNDTHLAVYNRGGSAVGGGTHIGSVPGNLQIAVPFTDGNAYSDQYSATTGRVVSASGNAPYGLMIGSRTSLISHATYKGGALLASNATSGGVLPTASIFVFAGNTGAGSPSQLTSHPISSYSVGNGLSAADVTTYNTIEQAFQTALGRNV